MDYIKIANEIVEAVGGSGNVLSVTHCMTRLRFTLKDKNLANVEAIKKIEGVLGNTFSAGQMQIILGKNLLPTFEEIVKNNRFEVGETVDENLDNIDPGKGNEEKKLKDLLKKFCSGILNYIVSSITPMIPGLIAGGMLKVFLLIFSLIWPFITKTQSYQLINFLSTVPFYFMPIFVAFGGSKKMGSTPVYAMIVAAGLIYPDFVALVTAGKPITLFGMPVMLVKYSSSLLPALLSTYAVAKLEKLFNKIIPGIFKAIFVGMLTITVGMVLTLVVLGPLGTFVGNYVVAFLLWLQTVIGPVALALVAAILPYMIMTGMHNLFSPVMVQLLSSTGYDSLFRPALILHNMSEGGACFAVALKTKSKDLRSEAVSCGIGCIFAGVTEPAIYGITLRLKKPLFGVSAGGAAGGLVAGALGAKAFVMGYSTILAVPIFENTITAILLGIATAIVVSGVVTYILGFEDIKK
ncbi:PTS transporter subunit EIIC [Caproicibacter sp. BJN0012]|uniref:PTS transporter subunit EIIC n=1 Tax=Caproicibacter sp. BJN0012 TaxID=3110227 RepID=UPI002E129A37|nr:PTS transporter subunit EIIC [Caproicibacter sp. BJN0012]